MRKINNDPSMLLFGNMIGAPSIMMYENTINLEFDKRMKWLVDIDFYIRLLKDNNFVYTKSELVSINIAEDNRVTNACIDNRKINIYETMIMFEKFNLKDLNYSYKLYFLKLFLKFNVISNSDINDCGYSGVIHVELSKLFKYVIFLLPIYNVLRKVIKS